MGRTRWASFDKARRPSGARGGNENIIRAVGSVEATVLPRPAEIVGIVGAFLKGLARGAGGFIGSHSASDTFHTANEAKKGPDRYANHGKDADPYVRMLGGEFIKHGKQQSAKMRCTDPKFPGMEKAAAAKGANR